MKSVIFFLMLALAAWADLVGDVRALNAKQDFAAGEKLVADFRKTHGETPEMILALSWLGRGAQAAKQWDLAERYAQETRKLSLEALKKRKLDDEEKLPLALGASIEVQGHTMAGRNQRTEAVLFLKEELKQWHDTSIRTRIQKNIHLLSLEGKPSPRIEVKEYLGEKPLPVAKLKGKPVILFFWAHWCGDCKQQGPVLQQLQKEYADKGLVVMGPTQRYGYMARGQDAGPEEELKYIEQVRQQYYGGIEGMACPVSEENFRSWGSSTTPTVVVVDRKGVVKLYHPGKMTYEELKPVVESVVGG